MLKFLQKILRKPANTSETKLPLQEFTFVWYHKMVFGNKTMYSKPFRTKIQAVNYDEAKKKAIDFINVKTQLVIVDETNYPKTDLGEMERTFDSFNETMDKFSKLFDKKKKGYESDFNF